MKHFSLKVNNIYLDASATTPLHESVVEEINRVNSNYWGNPSSIHSHGIQAAEILERSRLTIATKLGCSFEEVIFTSGATESVFLAINGIAQNLKKGRIVISSVEHPAVQSAVNSLRRHGWIVDYWPVDNKGNIRLDLTDKILSVPTKIVSIIWGQNEIGTIQPIHLIGQECNKRNIIFHTDATQLLPHCLFKFNQLSVDLLSASAHKFQGPKGIGILLCKKELKDKLTYIQGGGPQEFGLRAGTEAISLISGAAKAIELIKLPLKFNNSNSIMPKSFVSNITIDLYNLLKEFTQLEWIGNELNTNRLPNHLSFLLKDTLGNPLPSRRLVRELSSKGVAISSGSACSSGSLLKSNTLSSIGLDQIWHDSGLRITLGPWLDYNQIELIPPIINEALLSFD